MKNVVRNTIVHFFSCDSTISQSYRSFCTVHQQKLVSDFRVFRTLATHCIIQSCMSPMHRHTLLYALSAIHVTYFSFQSRVLHPQPVAGKLLRFKPNNTHTSVLHHKVGYGGRGVGGGKGGGRGRGREEEKGEGERERGGREGEWEGRERGSGRREGRGEEMGRREGESGRRGREWEEGGREWEEGGGGGSGRREGGRGGEGKREREGERERERGEGKSKHGLKNYVADSQGGIM